MLTADTVTEVARLSWFQRLGSSLKGVAIGCSLLLSSFALLWWNEGRAVHTARALLELKGAVVSVSADRVEAANEGKPVHITGDAATDAVLADESFGVTAPAIKLRRNVEMYQWQQKEEEKTREKFGGGTETTTTYSYSLTWSKDRIDSSDFAYRKGHENPEPLRYASTEKTADQVTVGAFSLSPGLVQQYDNFTPLPVADILRLSSEDKRVAVVNGEAVYLPNSLTAVKPDPTKPRLGDLRISWEVARPAQVSLIARQYQSTFEPWQASTAEGMGTTVQRLRIGAHSADAMIGQLEAENTLLTWILRLAGFVLMSISLATILSPLAILASIIPLFGNMTRSVIGLTAMMTSGVLSLLTIGLAWIAYRPTLGIALLVVAAGVTVVGFWLVRKRAVAATTVVSPSS